MTHSTTETSHTLANAAFMHKESTPVENLVTDVVEEDVLEEAQVPAPHDVGDEEPDFPESVFPAQAGEANVALDEDEEPDPDEE